MVKQHVAKIPSLGVADEREGEGLPPSRRGRRDQKRGDFWGLLWAPGAHRNANSISQTLTTRIAPRTFYDAISRTAQYQSLFSDLCDLCGSAVENLGAGHG